jgi:hypothetical protein
MKTLTVLEWRDQRFPKDCVPEIETIWRWIRCGKIQPAPVRVGRHYQLHPDAMIVGEHRPYNWKHRS